jgi:hypothetical protein
LRKPLSGASSEIYERREARTTPGRSSAAAQDADAEDAALDDAADTASGTNPGTSAKRD